MSPKQTHSQLRTRKARPGFTRPDWRTVVDPAFVAYWSAKKENEKLPRIKDPKEVEQFFEKWWRDFKKVSEGLRQATSRLENPLGTKILEAVLRPLEWEGLPRSDAPSGVYAINPEASPIFRQLVFLKFGLTFRELAYQIDIQKSEDAHRKHMAVHRDYWRMTTGTLPRDLKLKFSADHFEILIRGLDFGLDKPTPEELAECLDEICPCSQRHAAEYLKKLRTRIKKAVGNLTTGQQIDIKSE